MTRRPRMSGKVLQDAIVELAHLHGWTVAHFRNARTADGRHLTAVAYDAKGYPDLTLVRDRVVWIEVKGDGDRIRPDQRQWIDVLQGAGQEVHVVTPAMWLAGDLDPVLDRRDDEGAADAA